ncbi:hypothetical protein J1N35_018223 [Gossypium stocksii]|uniref:Endonuclease/exonuclease/phosphatase domain-containing protein n=1 Tax=Gossypium stocksii TaxID=47602 RepID=A0A9D3VNL1_9ROSI|nr:hypothetical protein J1N35_018223 [Gossypium stocksii]
MDQDVEVGGHEVGTEGTFSDSSGSKARNTIKMMGGKDGSIRVSREINKIPHGKGNALKIKNSAKISLRDSTSRGKRKTLWTDLLDVVPQDPLPWLILGDFNAILSVKEKKVIVPLVKDLDHRPILLKTNPELRAPKGKPFHFIVGWTKHTNFNDLDGKKWSFSGNIATTVSEFTLHAKEWNRTVYGLLEQGKRKLLRSLEDIQKVMEFSSSRRLANLELEIRDELESFTMKEIQSYFGFTLKQQGVVFGSVYAQ